MGGLCLFPQLYILNFVIENIDLGKLHLIHKLRFDFVENTNIVLLLTKASLLDNYHEHM